MLYDIFLPFIKIKMTEKYNSKKPMTFERKIKEISDSKNLAIDEREKVKKELIEAIEQDQDSRELYETYCSKKNEISWYNNEIDNWEKKRAEVKNMPIYSKTPEWQDELLAWDEVYQLLKNGNNEELLNALMERRMSVDQYKELSHFWLAEKLETKEQRILRVMEAFNSWLPLKVKVWNKWNWKWTKTINDEWTFETMIWEEYILNRISRYFSRTWITQDDLKEAIKFPEWVKITKPEDTEIKFECGGMKWTIKVEFVMLDFNNDKEKEVSVGKVENEEILQERDASSKELFHRLEIYIKGFLWDNLAEAKKEDIQTILGRLKDAEWYREFCDTSGKKLRFPHSFKDFLDKIAPIELDEEKLIAILQSNYQKEIWDVWGALVFDAKCFKNYRGHPELGEKYQKRNDYIKHYPELNESQKEELESLRTEIHKIEKDIIETYYPHLREAYFKDQMSVDKKH